MTGDLEKQHAVLALGETNGGWMVALRVSIGLFFLYAALAKVLPGHGSATGRDTLVAWLTGGDQTGLIGLACVETFLAVLLISGVFRPWIARLLLCGTLLGGTMALSRFTSEGAVRCGCLGGAVDGTRLTHFVIRSAILVLGLALLSTDRRA